MSRRFFSILVVFVFLLSWAPSTQLEAKPGACEDGTLIYSQEMDYWICMGYVAAGPACILCHGEAIDVVG